MAKKTTTQIAINKMDRVIRNDRFAIGTLMVGVLVIGASLVNKLGCDYMLKELLMEQDAEDRVEARRQNEEV